MTDRRVSFASSMVALALCVATGCAGSIETDRPAEQAPRTGDWLGETPPGDRATVFAPEVVSRGWFARDLAMTPDGNEIYFTVMLPAFEFATILVARREAGVWQEPQVASFSGSYRDLEPFVTPDGETMFFVSFRPEDGSGTPSSETNIWVMDRTESGWSDPRPLGPPINGQGNVYFPTTTRDGVLYFTRRGSDGDEAIYRAEPADGGYAEPVRLPPEVNAGRARYNAFVSPDDRFLIVPTYGLDDSLGATDYYVSFHEPDGGWVGPIHLGDQVNSDSPLEYAASLSPDGRYLFFMSARGEFSDREVTPPLTAESLREAHERPGNGNPSVYWIDASFIETLRPEGSIR